MGHLFHFLGKSWLIMQFFKMPTFELIDGGGNRIGGCEVMDRSRLMVELSLDSGSLE